MKTYMIMGVMLMLLALLLVPTTALACHADICKCIDANGVLHIKVWAKDGTVHWNSFTVYKGGVQQGPPITVNMDITENTYLERTWGTGLNPADNYTVVVDTDKDENYKTDCVPCPPVPETATIGLFSIGLLAMGGFVWYSSHRRKEVVD
jgi:hypothetical protein